MGEFDLYDLIGQNDRVSAENPKAKSLAEAKAHFSECIRGVERGESIVLTRHGRPVARLVPLGPFEGKGGLRSDERGLEVAGEVREPPIEYEPTPAAAALDPNSRRTALERLLEEEIWPQIPAEMLGKGPTKREREEILGTGAEDQ